jgi:hypothetical protein
MAAFDCDCDPFVFDEVDEVDEDELLSLWASGAYEPPFKYANASLEALEVCSPKDLSSGTSSFSEDGGPEFGGNVAETLAESAARLESVAQEQAKDEAPARPRVHMPGVRRYSTVMKAAEAEAEAKAAQAVSLGV